MKVYNICSWLKDTSKRVKLGFIAMNKYLTLDSNGTAKTSTIQSYVIFHFFSLLTACNLEYDMPHGEKNEG